MKRVIFGGIITVVFVLLGASCAIAAHSNTRDTNNFTITNYDVQLELGRDRNNHSTLKTIETITADFPPDQNHGITRQFVKKYDGHATNFTLAIKTRMSAARKHTLLLTRSATLHDTIAIRKKTNFIGMQSE